MKKILVLLLSISMLTSCSNKNSIEDMVINPNLTYLDDVKAIDVDMSSYKGFDDKEHVYKKINFNESLRFIEEKASAVVFYGYSSCSYCVQVAPVLNEIAKEVGLTVYYVDVHAETIADNHLEEFMGYYGELIEKDQNGEPAFYVPQVSVIVNGEIKSTHIGVVDSFSGSGDITEKQKEELVNIFSENLKEMLID